MAVTCRNEMAGESASSTSVHHSTNVSMMNSKILVLYHKILTGCIYYNEKEYKQDSILASE
jgi:hypothetical protein